MDPVNIVRKTAGHETQSYREGNADREARRGFDLPRHLEAEYTLLTRSKRMPAKEAAMMLGIPLDDQSA